MSRTESSPSATAVPARPVIRRGIALGAIVAVVAIGVVLRFAVRSDLWLDEALTVNIARLPLGEIPGALKVDGAPPLYYVLLHLWMLVFGESDAAVRALPALLGVATLPLAYLAGRRIGGPESARAHRVGLVALVLVAASPYAIRYSSENRMYILVIDLVLVGYLVLHRALERPTVGRLAAVAAVVAALLYTNYWCLYVLAVVGGITVWRGLRAPTGGEPDERATARRILVAMIVGGFCFVPWVPTFLFQTANTGTPWGAALAPTSAFAFTVLDFGGSSFAEGWPLALILFLLAVLALFGRDRDARHIDLDLATVPGARWEWAVGTGALGLGLALAYVSGTAFQTRYAAMSFPLYVLAVAVGVMCFRDLRVRAGILAVVVAIGFVSGFRNAVTDRTQATEVATALRRGAAPGDVVGYCPDQLGPDVSRLLPASLGLRQFAYPGFAAPYRIDWTDYAERNRRADPVRFARELERRAGDRTVWFVWSGGYRTYRLQCERVISELARLRGNRTIVVNVRPRVFEHMGLDRFAP
ncbi:MAG: glycosyltransferase family 39 protein [Actinomycetes bacterium]